MKASDVINSVRGTLMDEDSNNYRWSDSVLRGYVYDALLQLIGVRPDVTATTDKHKLSPGTLQSIPSDALKLLDIPRNLGSDGATPGYTVTPIDREDMDTLDRAWHKRTAKDFIEHYAYDEKVPQEFYVTPPVTDSKDVYVEVQYAAKPAEITANEDVLPVEDIYKGSLVQWVLSLAYSQETGATSEQRSRRYEQSFYNSLGVKSQVDSRLSPHPDREQGG